MSDKLIYVYLYDCKTCGERLHTASESDRLLEFRPSNECLGCLRERHEKQRNQKKIG